MPVTAQEERCTPQSRGDSLRELDELLRCCHLTSAPPPNLSPPGMLAPLLASMTGTLNRCASYRVRLRAGRAIFPKHSGIGRESRCPHGQPRGGYGRVLIVPLDDLPDW